MSNDLWAVLKPPIEHSPIADLNRYVRYPREVNDTTLRQIVQQQYCGSVLIDTQVLIWSMLDPERLSPFARTVIEEGRVEMLVSAVSAWEIVLKTRKGLFPFRNPGTEARDMVSALQAGWISVDPNDTYVLELLPERKNHKDPFDRMLVAQAIRRSIPLISSDERILEYAGHPLEDGSDSHVLAFW